VHREPGLNVLLITVDTLRADALGAYGHDGAETPRMDRLAAGGVRFDFAHAHNVVTLPSHANILSGRYPFEHGVRENSGFRFPPGVETLATLLGSQGYRTAAFVSAFPLDSRFGLDRGFEVYDDRLGDFEAKPDFQMQERPAAKTVAAAIEWRDATPGPKLCWLHLYEPHAPYQPPSSWRGRPYDGEVAATDRALAPLLDPILASGAASDTLVVLTSDHGEGLGEHGEATHGIFAYESTLRVPLVLHHPRLFSPRVVGESVRHVDLLPTILDALALPVPAGISGRSLLAAAQGRRSTEPPPSYFESLTPALIRGWAPIHGVLRGRVKYIDLPIPELFDLGPDPAETRNLLEHGAAAPEQMRAVLARHRAADRGIVPVGETPEVRERLASLGYVETSRRGEHHDDASHDPKRNMGFEAGLHEVLEAWGAGAAQDALARCERLVLEWPGMPVALRHLSFLRHQAGDLEGAVDAGRQALAADPSSVDSAAQLGRFLNDLGRPGDTVALLSSYVEDPEPDIDILMTYGAALARTGQREQAIAALERAGQIDPTSALAALNLGTAHLLFGDAAAAHVAFETALEHEPDLARAWNALGLLAAEGGAPTEAIRCWRRALAINPHEPDTLYNLGAVLLAEGRAAEARTPLERFLLAAPPALYGPDLVRVRGWLAGPDASRSLPPS
jgi:arylsulfatase A-like enzyme/tetratricopeptide (TPR) repeat protein